MPEKMSFEEGASLPVSYLMAYLLLFKFGDLRSGQSVLCHIAAGGVVSLCLLQHFNIMNINNCMNFHNLIKCYMSTQMNLYFSLGLSCWSIMQNSS